MGIITVAAPSVLLSLAGVSSADWAAEDTDGEWVPEATLPQVCPSHAAATGSQESALPAGEGGKTGPSETNHLIFLLVADNLLTVNDSTATCVFTFVSHLLSLLCPLQARQDILAQDLAEAIDSQVELAEHLRCYREENEKLNTEKQGVCMCACFCASCIMDQELPCKFSQTSMMESAIWISHCYTVSWRAKAFPQRISFFFFFFFFLFKLKLLSQHIPWERTMFMCGLAVVHSLAQQTLDMFNTLVWCVCDCVQLLDQKECLSLQVQQLTLDCNMHQQKITVIQNQMRELQAERDQVRDRWQPHHSNFPSSISCFWLYMLHSSCTSEHHWGFSSKNTKKSTHSPQASHTL